MRRFCLRLLIALLSLGGVAAGHQLAFWFAAPDAHHRRELLATTGHDSSWVPALVGICAALALAAVAGKVTSRYLVIIQVVAFTLLEGAERLVAHDDVTRLLQQPVFYVGVLLQILIALAGYLVARLLVSVVRLLMSGSAPARRDAVLSSTWTTQNTPRLLLARVAWNLRGPPSLCVTA